MNCLQEQPQVYPHNEIIIVKLWEIYLLYHPANLYKILTERSLDNGPADDQTTPGKVIFNFARKVWDSEIRVLLHEYKIPVTVHQERHETVVQAGRQPIVR